MTNKKELEHLGQELTNNKSKKIKEHILKIQSDRHKNNILMIDEFAMTNQPLKMEEIRNHRKLDFHKKPIPMPTKAKQILQKISYYERIRTNIVTSTYSNQKIWINENKKIKKLNKKIKKLNKKLLRVKEIKHWLKNLHDDYWATEQTMPKLNQKN